jgi:hypothetical protein
MKLRSLLTALSLATAAVAVPQAAHATEADTEAPVIVDLGHNLTKPVRARQRFTPVISDDTAVSKVELVINGTVVDTDSTPDDGWVLSWNTFAWSGRVDVLMLAYDAAGNTGRLTDTVTVDNLPPAATATAAAHNGWVHGLVPITVSGAESDVHEIYIQPGPAIVHPTTPGPWVLKVDTTDRVHASPLSVVVHVLDRAGNRTNLPVNATVDNAPPTLSLPKGPASGALIRGWLTYEATTFDSNEVTSELLVNGKRVAAQWMPAKTTATKRLSWNSAGVTGPAKLTVRAPDWFGQRREITRTITADNSAPSVWISKGPGDKAKVSGKVTIGAGASDKYGVHRVELLVNGKLVAKDYTSGYSFTLNTAKQSKTMKIQIRAYDRAGNVKYTPSRTWYRR